MLTRKKKINAYIQKTSLPASLTHVFHFPVFFFVRTILFKAGAPTISVDSYSCPLLTNACRTSAAACRWVARSVLDADIERSRRIKRVIFRL